jgi:hypothetical protein
MEQPESFDKISSQEIHGHSFWLYTVIVGLSVEEALRHVLPHVGELSLSMDRELLLEIVSEFIRLALFLTLVVRFYLGSVRYFSQAHLTEQSDVDYQNKNYTYDFFIGLIHFSAFLALSLSIDSKQYNGMWLFWLSFILLYDFMWLAGSRKYDTAKIIRFWTYLNGFTFSASWLLYLAAAQIFTTGWLIPKAVATINQTIFMLPIFFFSFLDIREVLKSDPVLPNWISNVIKRK